MSGPIAIFSASATILSRKLFPACLLTRSAPRASAGEILSITGTLYGPRAISGGFDASRWATQTCDYIRLDHFRGFAQFWEIPANEPTAVNGRWVDGPGDELFYKLKESLGTLPFFAEDLGVITPDVTAIAGTAQDSWHGGIAVWLRRSRCSRLSTASSDYRSCDLYRHT